MSVLTEEEYNQIRTARSEDEVPIRLKFKVVELYEQAKSNVGKFVGRRWTSTASVNPCLLTDDRRSPSTNDVLGCSCNLVIAECRKERSARQGIWGTSPKFTCSKSNAYRASIEVGTNVLFVLRLWAKFSGRHLRNSLKDSLSLRIYPFMHCKQVFPQDMEKLSSIYNDAKPLRSTMVLLELKRGLPVYMPKSLSITAYSTPGCEGK